MLPHQMQTVRQPLPQDFCTRHNHQPSGVHLTGERGFVWFLVWTAAGFLMSFSLVTGFSIGLLIVPFAAALLLWVARRAPHLPETAGFAVGIALTALLIVALNT